MCRTCWGKVPEDRQREVYRTVRLRDGSAIDSTWAPWWRAQARAIDSVLKKDPGVTTEQRERLLDRELAFAQQLEDRDRPGAM